MADQSSSKGATLTFVLGIFAGFAVLLTIIQAIWGESTINDPREEERLKNKDEITATQTALIEKMGLKDKAKSADLYAKTAAALKTKTPKASAMLVPGSPTQLKQAEAASAAPAPAAAPAATPAPAAAKPAAK
jgi:hypothetical protein